MKRKTWLRRHPRCAVLATGALALLISALPLAALHMADVPLFTSSHGRSWRSVQSVQMSGEDLYLVQTLRERNWQDFYWQSEEIEIMDEGFTMLGGYIEDLAEAGVLDAEWLDMTSLSRELEEYLILQEHYLTCSYMRDSAGFLTLNVWEKDSNGMEYAPWEEITLESTMGKVTSFYLVIPQGEFDLTERLRCYVDYLGLSGLDDWQVWPDEEGQGDMVTLYSKKAKAYVSMYSIVGIVPEGIQIAGALYPESE